MWTSFWPDLIIAIFSSALTVLIAYVTYRLNLRNQENQALRSLVNDLHARRALAKVTPEIVINAETINDYANANASVLLMKDEIKRARENIRSDWQIESELRTMTKYCNDYLEQSQQIPDRYQYGLSHLTAKLGECVRNLSSLRPSVPFLWPGGGAMPDISAGV